MERRLAAIMAADMVGYSRLMERDQAGVLNRQKTYRRQLIDPEIDRYHGRIVKTTGDGMLAEFPSALDAVRCSIDIQQAMHDRESDTAPDEKIQYRVGVNLGDVIIDEADIFGDGVNVASRLEGLAAPGGICVSDMVLQAVGDRVSEGFRDMGSQRVKNISRPIRVWQWTRDSPDQPPKAHTALQQKVKFCRSADGTQIAWASTGQGTPILKAPHWMTHIEHEWQVPLFAPVVHAISETARFVRFDQRGNGLSDWDVKDFSLNAMQQDIKAVADAAGLDRFAIYAASQGAAFSLAFARENPGRVSCLVIVGGYLRGRMKRDAEQAVLYETAMQMIRNGWGSPNPLFRQFFTSSFIPDASRELQEQFDEVQRISVNAENAARLFEVNAHLDVMQIARETDIPVLVLHAQGDRIAPIEVGREVARTIPGAQFVEMPCNNHIPLEGTPAFDMMIEETMAFVRANP